MSDLVSFVEQSILARRLLRRGQSILVAVSGGLDSMVLLHLLHRLGTRQKWKLWVAHFNHRLRGRSSDADERLVRRTAQQLRLPFTSASEDLRRRARLERKSVELAARHRRHAFLADAARRRGIHAIALAHHADDQAELFFLRLLRGTGSTGLAGMRWISPSPNARDIRLVRPLLDCTRAQLQQFAQAEKVPFREDASNASLDIERNRIRHELLPLLRERYQPAVSKLIVRVMAILEAEGDFLKETVDAWLQQKPRKPFEHWPVAVQRQYLRAQLGLWDLWSFHLVEALRRRAGDRVTISAKEVVWRDAEGAVQREALALTEFDENKRCLDLTATQGESQFDGVTVRWRVVRQKGIALPQRANCEFFDADKVGSSVVLRHWCRGDHFQPIGLKTAVKLQDWFTNRKVPRPERHRLLVATTAPGEIFWVEGQRIAERFKLDNGSRRRLKWAWSR
jgi:tRNA(Ile)-lysidine synthase